MSQQLDTNTWNAVDKHGTGRTVRFDALSKLTPHIMLPWVWRHRQNHCVRRGHK